MVNFQHRRYPKRRLHEDRPVKVMSTSNHLHHGHYCRLCRLPLYKAHGVPHPTWRDPARGPFPAPPTFALRLPNCIARLTLLAVIVNPAISAASRSSRFSPSPSGRVKSHFSQIGNDDRYAMNDNDKYGYRASRANEERIRSSREVFRVGRRPSSCWI